MSSKFAAAFVALSLAAAAPAPAFADTEYVYDSAGRLIKVTYSNGIVIEYRYDASGNRQQITTAEVPNRAPRARADNAAVEISASIDIPVLGNDTDPDRDPLTITAVSSPTGGTATILQNPWRVRYVAPASAGEKTFTYTISDGQAHTATATVKVLVSTSNQPPVAIADSVSASTDTSMTFFVLSNDSDPNGNTLTVTAVSTPNGGAAAIAPGGSHIVYDAPSTVGTYTFTYTANDGAGGSANATVTVNVSLLEGPGGCVPAPGVTCEDW